MKGNNNHRLVLRRNWIGNGKTVCFIMLNPSTATDRDDDTLRCIRILNDPLSTESIKRVAQRYIDAPCGDRDDQTIRKCCGFAKRWGYSGIIVVNLFAFRATDPKDLRELIRHGKLDIAIGEGNDEAIANAANEADLVVMAWGANAAHYPNRVAQVMKVFLRPFCIATTVSGHPLHPCMAAYTDDPVPFIYPAAHPVERF